MPAQAPYSLAMLLCDAVQTDRVTGKVTILGAFAEVVAPGYPARHPELVVFAELTDGRGLTPITLKICRTSTDSLDGDEHYRFGIDVNFPNPRLVARLTIKIAPLDLPQTGEYRFILECEGAFIAERRLLALIRS